MSDILRRLILPLRTDPLEAPTTPQMAPWPEVLACLHPVEALAEAGTAFQLVETPGQVACVLAEVPAAPAKAAAPRPRRAAAKG